MAVPAGRGSGKTELAKRRLVRYLPVKKKWHDPRYFYGAPTEGQAKRIAWQHFQDLIPEEWIKNIVGLRIQTIFGSELWVVGLDKPQRVEGVQWDGCVLDESCDIKPGTFDRNVLPALAWRNGWCWRIGVPKRQGVGAQEFKEFFESALTGAVPDAAGFTWPSSGIVPDAVLRHAQEMLDAKDYNEQFNARFETAGGGIFYAFDREYNVRPCTYRPNQTIIIGSDFNVDPMCWVIGHFFQKHIEWFDEIFKRDTNTEETLKVLYGRYSQHRSGFEFYGDATGDARKTSASISDYKRILNHEGFKRLGRTIHYARSNPRIADRFASTNAMFCNAAEQRRMFIDPRCVNLIKDCEARYYKPGTTEPADIGVLGHMTDALGYPVHYRFPLRVQMDSVQGEVYVSNG